MLGACDVRYMLRTAIKGQVLADFVAKFTENIANYEKGVTSVMMVSAFAIATWEVYTDGATNRKGSRVEIVLIIPEKLVMEKSMRLAFLTTNNDAEYEALLAGMAMVNKLGGEVIEMYSDS